MVASSLGRVKLKTIKLVGISCFSAEHAAIRSKSKDWFARYQDNVSEFSDIYTHRLLFRWASTIIIQVFVLYKVDIIIMLCSNHDIAEKLLYLALKVN